MLPCPTATPQSTGLDGNYVHKLYRGDPDTRVHFFSYFGERLELKLRCRLQSWSGVPELRDEVLKRALAALNAQRDQLAQVRIVSLVNSVCNEVLSE